MLTSDQMELYQKNMYAISREGYKLRPVQYDKIFSIKKDVTGAGDKFTQLLGADKFAEKTVQGKGFVFRSPVQGFQSQVSYKTFYDAVQFDKEEVEDNVKSGAIGRTLNGYAESWGDAYRVTKEEFCASFFNYGGLTSGNAIFNGSWGDNTDSSGDLVYDSKPLFNLTGNARTAKDGTTYYNSVTSSALNPTNFNILYDLMAVTNGYNEVGVRVENKPDTLLTQDGSDFRAARKLLESEKESGGQLNDKNILQGIVKPLSWSYLENDAWFVMKVKQPELAFEDRQKPLIDFYRNKETRGYMATVDARFGVHLRPGVWRNIARNGGSSAANVAAM